MLQRYCSRLLSLFLGLFPPKVHPENCSETAFCVSETGQLKYQSLIMETITAALESKRLSQHVC